jgi:hypothetical protein
MTDAEQLVMKRHDAIARMKLLHPQVLAYKEAEKELKNTESKLIKIMKSIPGMTITFLGKLLKLGSSPAKPKQAKIGAIELMNELEKKGYSRTRLESIYNKLFAEKTTKNKNEADGKKDYYVVEEEAEAEQVQTR